eukprot:m.369065 g.369065  ORF g.369065 m.369065 type:complete len:136 (-) comp28118_c0_seq19:80-487(-)
MTIELYCIIFEMPGISSVWTPVACSRRRLGCRSPARPRRDGGVGTHVIERRMHREHGTAMSHFTLDFLHPKQVRGRSTVLPLAALSGDPNSSRDTICHVCRHEWYHAPRPTPPHQRVCEWMSSECPESECHESLP